MSTTVDTKAIAEALYDSLISTAAEQLQAAAAKLTGGGGSNAAQQIDAALPSGALPQVRNFLLGLANEGLLDQAGPIAAEFAAFRSARATQVIDALVTSATELSEAQQKTIADDLRQRYSGTLKISYSVDPSLIGGLIIRVGDRVLDNSLRTRLNALQRNMLSS